MDAAAIIAIVVVALVVIAAIVAFAVIRARQRRHLQERFGPEYDRTVDGSGSTRAAEKNLTEREQVREELDLRQLTDAERTRYHEQWDGVQATFVDRPASAVRDADELVARVMRDRGYPVDDFEQQAELISVDHPDVVSNYRAAHDIAVRSGHDGVTTEDQREAFVHYRALYDELLDGRDDGPDQSDRSGTAQPRFEPGPRQQPAE